jgi:2-polyprenyl-3-methyl-5-hydroxy-6-metoxy-1,4-benzoquinol methylase
MTANPSPQNIYDDPAFFAGYTRLERFGAGWTKAYEYPAFMSLLPDPAGLRALDLGCGAGRLAHHLAESGAAEVIGVDLSERMLEVARAECSHPKLTFQRASMEEAAFPSGRFDLVVSSFAFHYVPDFSGLARRISDWLSPGGILVFSNEHPVYLSRAAADGWVRDAARTPQHWALSRYGEEGLREESWIADGVQKYHRMVSTILNDLIEAGFVIERVLEPMPDEATLRQRPAWVHERHRPFCLLVRARKPGRAMADR